jgi:hypothetical protein
VERLTRLVSQITCNHAALKLSHVRWLEREDDELGVNTSARESENSRSEQMAEEIALSARSLATLGAAHLSHPQLPDIDKTMCSRSQ